MRVIGYNLEDDELEFADGEKLEDILSKSGDVYIKVKCDFNISNIIEKLETIKKKINDRTKLEVNIEYDGDYIYNEKEIQKLKNLYEYCKSINARMNVCLNSASGEYNNFVIAKNQIEDFVKKVNSMTINENGKQVPLSPLEKYFVVYKFVASRVYNESEDVLDDRMRNWIGVLSSDKVICSGFASLLKCVCDRVFDKNELSCYVQGSNVYNKNTGEWVGAHANNLLIVNDKKYNVSGLFTSDSCWGSLKKQNDMLVTYEYCLNPISIYAKHNKYIFGFPKELFFYNNIDGIKIEDDRACCKTTLLSDIAKEIDIPNILFEERKEIIDKRRKKAKAEYDKKQDEYSYIINEELSEFIKNNNLQDFCKIEIPNAYPKDMREQYPELNDYEEFFDNLTVEQLQLNLQKFKDFEEFYHKHKSDIFDVLEQRAMEIFGSKFSNSAYDKIKWSCERNSGIKPKSWSKLEQETDREIRQASVEAFQKGKDFLIPPNIPKEAFKNGLASVAMYSGITDNIEIQNYVENEIRRSQKLRENAFVMK